jgi:hypothetical protein
MMTLDTVEHAIDEALWDAYRRCDKCAVTENLLRRCLPELTFVPNVSAVRVVARTSWSAKFPKDGFGVQMTPRQRTNHEESTRAWLISNEGSPRTSRVIQENLANAQ